MLLVLPLMAGATSADEGVDGDNGVLYVSGELTRGACNIEGDSKQQAVRMGTIGSGELTLPGRKAHGKAFHLHLRNCISSGPEEEERQTGTVVRVEDQPEARISFISARNADDPQLIAVQGAEGFGLRLEDHKHHLIQPGGEGEPLVLQTSNDDLVYWLIPERTRAKLQEGAWRTTVYMRLSYE
ncbi:fimbrial protein [Pantoea sp. BAV 3049]|uniref:fimbrial protein n=1 Tax=Pantoea sp. BAV 3049 TaxID=2654188 RepID=UPI00131E49B5|nr:fimbrial protein [Pantoea sp. BAV 3049]